MLPFFKKDLKGKIVFIVNDGNNILLEMDHHNEPQATDRNDQRASSSIVIKRKPSELTTRR
jgi:hypothetical protein